MGRHDCPDDSYYRCLCQTHVHKGTMIIGILGIILNIPLVFSVFQAGNLWYFGVTSGVNIISLITYVCLLVGNRKEIPVLYLPFLIINTIVLVFLLLCAIGLFIGAGLIFAGKVTKIDSSLEGAAGGLSIAIGILYIFLTLLQFYFFYVVWRGYKYLKNVLLDPCSNLPRVN